MKRRRKACVREKSLGIFSLSAEVNGRMGVGIARPQRVSKRQYTRRATTVGTTADKKYDAMRSLSLDNYRAFRGTHYTRVAYFRLVLFLAGLFAAIACLGYSKKETRKQGARVLAGMQEPRT